MQFTSHLISNVTPFHFNLYELSIRWWWWWWWVCRKPLNINVNRSRQPTTIGHRNGHNRIHTHIFCFYFENYGYERWTAKTNKQPQSTRKNDKSLSNSSNKDEIRSLPSLTQPFAFSFALMQTYLHWKFNKRTYWTVE